MHGTQLTFLLSPRHPVPQEWEQALWVLTACRRRQLQPHVVAYNALISTLAKCRWELALLIFLELELDVWPDVISYNAIINACAAGSYWQGALCFLMTALEALVQCDVLLLVVVT